MMQEWDTIVMNVEEVGFIRKYSIVFSPNDRIPFIM